MSTKVKMGNINGLSVHWRAFVDLSMQETRCCAWVAYHLQCRQLFDCKNKTDPVFMVAGQ